MLSIIVEVKLLVILKLEVNQESCCFFRGYCYCFYTKSSWEGCSQRNKACIPMK